jgi:hypothetical protein
MPHLRIRAARFVLPLAAALAATGATGQPRGGELDVSFCWAGTMQLTHPTKEIAFGTYQVSGGARAATPGALLDGAGVDCSGTFDNDQARGANRVDGWCVTVDRQGDRIWGRDTRRNDAHNFEFTGGTGKYAGMTGTVTIDRVMFPPTRAGALQGCSRMQGTLRAAG